MSENNRIKSEIFKQAIIDVLNEFKSDVIKPDETLKTRFLSDYREKVFWNYQPSLKWDEICSCIQDALNYLFGKGIIVGRLNEMYAITPKGFDIIKTQDIPKWLDENLRNDLSTRGDEK